MNFVGRKADNMLRRLPGGRASRTRNAVEGRDVSALDTFPQETTGRAADGRSAPPIPVVLEVGPDM